MKYWALNYVTIISKPGTRFSSSLVPRPSSLFV